MAEAERIDLLGLLRKAGLEHDTDFLREGVRVLTQARSIEPIVTQRFSPGKQRPNVDSLRSTQEGFSTR